MNRLGGVRLTVGSPLMVSDRLFGRRSFAGSQSSKLFIGGLSYDTNETVLRDAFQKFGDIIEVKVICDHVNGKSKGYGFIQFDSDTAAGEAIKQMEGQSLDGRSVRVRYAHGKGRVVKASERASIEIE